MYKILLVDDDREFRTNVAELLTLEGFDVVQAANGLIGLELARDTLPDLIICDINMPEIGGYEVLQELRQDFATANTAFIFLSSNIEQDQVREGMNLGADDYLTKPINNHTLLSTTRSRLKRMELSKQDQIRRYAQTLVTIQETERENLSMILRNHFGNMLSDLKLTLSSLSRLPEGAKQTTLDTSNNLLDHMINEVESMSHSLYPTTLKYHGIVATLYILVEAIRGRTQLQIDVVTNGLEAIDNESPLAIATYRIVQEALLNIEEHSQATHAEVKLWVEEDYLRLQIIDNGIGVNLEQIIERDENTGIIGMRERAQLLNGEFIILSDSDSGTQILAKLPIFSSQLQVTSSSMLQMREINRTMPAVEATHSTSSKAKVAVFDPNEISRWGLQYAVDNIEDFSVIHSLDDPAEIIPALTSSAPDIILAVLSSQSLQESQDMITEIRSQFEDIHIIVLANVIDYSYAQTLINCGSDGYVTKSSSLDEILQAIEAVLNKKNYIAQNVMATMPVKKQEQDDNEDLDAFSTLTDREREIFFLVIDGSSNRDISQQLFISPRTVETHRRNLMHKLGVRGAKNLMHYALNRGLLGK